MSRLIALLALHSAMIAQTTVAIGKPNQNTAASSISPETGHAVSTSILPAIPKGKSTVIGGSIDHVDLVRDQFNLKVFGGKPMKILFDERTKFYRDGAKTPLRDLRSVNHASVETVLDGTKVFALSVHVLSQSPEGECDGQVVKYDAGTGQLTIGAALSHEPIVLHVAADTHIARVGQNAFTSSSASASDLVPKTLIRARFTSGTHGHGIARQISIVATPGSSFVFIGSISFLDLHAHRLVVSNPRDNNTYQITFDPSQFPIAEKLHTGDRVKVNATFDGSSYVANSIGTLKT